MNASKSLLFSTHDIIVALLMVCRVCQILKQTSVLLSVKGFLNKGASLQGGKLFLKMVGNIVRKQEPGENYHHCRAAEHKCYKPQ